MPLRLASEADQHVLLSRLLCMCSYVTGSTRIDHKDDTKLAVDAEEQEALLERARSGASASTRGGYHFICECFFLTARSLHLGFVKTIGDLYSIARVRAPGGS